MDRIDDATEAYIARLLDEAPPLPADAAELVVRTFARPTDVARCPASQAA